jgi:hypothetical protein
MPELERLGVFPWQVLDAGVSRVDTSATEEAIDLTDEVIQGAGDQDDVRDAVVMSEVEEKFEQMIARKRSLTISGRS